MDRFIIISGSSGGGKSTLLSELKKLGHAVVEEPGRRIIAEENRNAGRALPWINLAAFAERAIETSLRDRTQAANIPGVVFFDRGLVDAAAALEHATGRPSLHIFATERYNRRVFATPPWQEIYLTDSDRRHGFREAIAEYERLLIAYASLKYDVEVLPKTGVAERADILFESLKANCGIHQGQQP